MEKILLLCGLLACQVTAVAVDIDVGGNSISIPLPAGYVQVTKAMEPFASYRKRFEDPSQVGFASFISPEAAAWAARGGMPDEERQFYVQVAKNLVSVTVSPADFAGIKHTFKTQNENVAREIEERMPGLLKKASAGVSLDYATDFNVTLSKVIPLPSHLESDRAYGYAMLMNYMLTGDGGKRQPHLKMVVVTLVHVRGRLLFLFVDAEKSSLAWAQEASKAWTEAVLAANP